ncbi:Spx/MgsR family RNA polymerase-binding regulatory protein [Temperatibacter marinus]|uniref:Spx/MgsR family RNA polymerase-binding regulatory protein n=1 Tax=Temperatibacter marinus TaxID=1456591 RepID=A0AA52H8D0_9PROT|nr:Spx/MgsR family RNA polymerase-binding regulatory protein [Temperatibacter marinus]WND02001.1 Spx/MgsR family RNA polymerase-binding regulatory protein [Temperatibacter marinus]
MITIFGIKNCDTIKKALKWLDSMDAEYKYHDFRKDGVDDELAKTLAEAVDTNLLINKRGTTWRKLDEATKEKVESGCHDTVIGLIKNEPAVVKRPVWAKGNTIFVGFKSEEQERVRTLL